MSVGSTFSRADVIAAAKVHVGDAGEVRDYPCDCEPGGERFLVVWKDDPMKVCYNLDELRARCNKKEGQ